MKESVNAIAKAISTVANEMVNVEDGYQTEMVQVVRQLTDVLEHVTKIPESVKTVTVTPIEEVKETVNVEVPVLEAVEEPSESASSADEVPEPPKPVVKKQSRFPEMKKVRRWQQKDDVWVSKYIEEGTIALKPDLKDNDDDLVDALLVNEARQQIFGNAETVEVHFPVWNLENKRHYVTETFVELPVEDLMNRKWTRQRVSNNHKRWFQRYVLQGGAPFTISLEMTRCSNKDTKPRLGLNVSENNYTKRCERKADGKLILASVLDGNFNLGYDTSKYNDGTISGLEEIKKFAEACGVQTVWDARNIKK